MRWNKPQLQLLQIAWLTKVLSKWSPCFSIILYIWVYNLPNKIDSEPRTTWVYQTFLNMSFTSRYSSHIYSHCPKLTFLVFLLFLFSHLQCSTPLPISTSTNMSLLLLPSCLPTLTTVDPFSQNSMSQLFIPPPPLNVNAGASHTHQKKPPPTLGTSATFLPPFLEQLQNCLL